MWDQIHRSRQFLLSCLLLLAGTVHAETPQHSAGMAGGIYYQTFGAGEPVLIINGGPGLDSAGFEPVAKAVAAQGFQAILFDQRGTGRSVLPEINASSIRLTLMVQDIEQLRQHLQHDKLTILGHSFGGMLAAAYAAKYPQHLQKLIFSSSGGLDLNFRDEIPQRLRDNLSYSEQLRLQIYQLRQRSGDDSAETRDKLAQLRARAYVIDKSKADGIAARLKVVNLQINSLVFADLEKTGFDLKTQFGNFTAPVLVLQGENDIISVDTAKTIAGSFNDAQLVLMPACAHYGWLDQPNLYYSALFAFLHPPATRDTPAAD